MFEILRMLAAITGVTLLAHIMCMASFLPKGTPWALALLLGVSASGAMGLVLGAITGDASFLLGSGIASSAGLASFLLWLWRNGLHINTFVKNLIGDRTDGRRATD